MALKDLASDLSAYKGQTTPTSIDSQIKEGVDFFPNDDASGFTPKTNLESLYNQVREGNVGQTWPEAAPTNDKTRQAFGQQGEYDVPDNVGRAVPSFLLNTDTLLGVRVQPQLLSPFLETPIADAVSMFNEDPFSVTYGTKSNPIRGDKKFNDRTYYHSGRQPAGLNRDFPFIPNAHKIAVVNTDPNKTFDVTTMDDMVYGGYNLPTQNSSAGSATIDIIHDKRRGVYNEMVNTFFEHQPFPPFQAPNVSNADESGAPLRYFSENNGKSIHISPEGELNAGFRYGAYQSEQFVNFNPGNKLTDVISEAPTTVGLGDRYSTYSNYPHINAEAPSNLIVGDETILAKWPDRAKTNLLSAFPSTDENPYDIGTVVTSNISDFFDKKSGVEKDGYDNLFEFSDGQFQNVPDGLNENNKFGTKKYREVANSGPFDGNDTHPLTLREIGSNWDSVLTDTPGLGGTLGNSVAGLLGVTGLLTRTSVGLADKARVFKFLKSPKGLSFVAKQFIFQGLNPTLESKVYNPLSALGIAGGSDLLEGDLGGLLSAAGSFLFPTHVERHLGNTRYEKVMEIGGTRIRWSADAFAQGVQVPTIPRVSNDLPYGIGEALNAELEQIENTATAAVVAPFLTLSNPNKYTFPISSAPKSITNGVPSFLGSAELALKDVQKAQNTPGGTFNKATSDSEIEGGNNSELVTRHSTLSYERLKDDFGYITSNENRILSPSEVSEFIDGSERSEFAVGKRKFGKDIVRGTGDAGAAERLGKGILGSLGDRLGEKAGEALGVTKGTTTSGNVDRINMIPIVDGDPISDEGIPKIITDNPDFIKFRFRDIVNKKFLVFRAILDGISDTVTPEYNPLEYIGRPDKLYTYKGVDRDISFNFKVYPKTKQELPVLMEKMNYLIGMCYPSYTDGERMVAPYMELTLGDMFVDAPGVLTSLTITVEDATTWEIEEGLQYPHFLSAQCTFKYIGKYTPVALGKFYDIPWLSDNRQINTDGSLGKPVGTFTENPAIKSSNLVNKNSSNIPYRRSDVYDYRWINTITGNSLEDGRPPAQESTTE